MSSNIPVGETITQTVVLVNGMAVYPQYSSPLVNQGTISPGGETGAVGVYSQDAGVSLTNSYNIRGGGGAGGTDAGAAVDLVASATVSNAQFIQGGTGSTGSDGGVGVLMTAGGTLSNTTATIHGGSVVSGGGTGGVGVSMTGGTFTNSDTADIFGGYLTGSKATGTSGAGVYMNGGTLITMDASNIEGGSAIYNGATGDGGDGVVLTAGGKGTNSVSSNIDGGQGHGSGGVGVDLNAGAQFTNLVTGGVNGGIGGTTGGAGLVASGVGTYVLNSGNIRGGESSHGTGGAGVELSSGATMTNDSSINGGFSGGASGGVGAEVSSGAQLTNNGSIDGGYQTVGVGEAAVYLDGGKLINSDILRGHYTGPETTGYSVQFGAVTGGNLTVEAGAKFYGDIGGFKIGDTVDVTNEPPPPAGTYPTQPDYWYAPNHTLYTDDGPLKFDGTFTGEHFVFTSDGAVGTDITLAEGAACFRRGTRIRTDQGEASIETLRIGDRVMTLSGAARAVRWIGRRRYSGSYAEGNRGVLPIRIRRGALGDGMPRRDLWVSPEHAMWLEGMLIPASALVNGMSIVQEDTVEEVIYVHLEFDTHDVIFAEGAPSESFVDDESRDQFDNAAEYWALYPYAVREAPHFYAPRVEDGVALEAVRRRLCARSEAARGEDSPWHGPWRADAQVTEVGRAPHSASSMPPSMRQSTTRLP